MPGVYTCRLQSRAPRDLRRHYLQSPGTRSSSRLVEQVGDGGDAWLDGPLADLAEPQDELRWPGRPARPEAAHPVQADPPLARGRSHGPLVGTGRQVRDGVEPRGKPGQPDAGGMPGEDGDEPGAPAGVERSHPAKVAIVAARLEQGREHELIQGRRATVADPLLLRDTGGQRVRREDPAEPYRRGERLAGRADGEDAVRGQSLDRKSV